MRSFIRIRRRGFGGYVVTGLVAVDRRRPDDGRSGRVPLAVLARRCGRRRFLVLHIGRLVLVDERGGFIGAEAEGGRRVSPPARAPVAVADRPRRLRQQEDQQEYKELHLLNL